MHSPFVAFERQADATSFYITCEFGPIQNFTILQKKKTWCFWTVSQLATQQPIHHLYIFWALFNYLPQFLPYFLKGMSWGLYGSEFKFMTFVILLNIRLSSFAHDIETSGFIISINNCTLIRPDINCIKGW